MKLSRRTARLALLFLTAATAAEPPAFPDLSGYDLDPTFALYWLAPHRQNGSGLRHQWEPVLALTTFHERGVRKYFTGPKGENYSHRNSGMAIQNTQGRELKPEDITRLRGLFRELPTTNARPALERLVLLSYRDGTNWTTRVYDNGDRPKPLQEIFQVIGERRDEYGKTPPR